MKIDYSAVDRKQLAKDIDDLRATVGVPSQEDFQHLRKIELWGRVLALLGYATAWIIPFNPFAALLISTANVCRWANVAHPILHGAYDKVPDVPKRYTRKGFAKGWWRRTVDWLDWISPEAWDVEHNKMHHYHLGEEADPDLIERNTRPLRNPKIPLFFRYLFVVILACIWKPFYYAPKTLMILNNIKRRKKDAPVWVGSAKNPFYGQGASLWLNCYLPYIFFRFVCLPALFLPLGVDAVTNVLLTSLLAELLTNLHSFLVIIPNHTAEDIYRFDEPSDSKGEFYLRQIIGSVNYTTGSDRVDFLHGWLNYQIEHHLLPFLPLSQYQAMRPHIMAICEKHGLPYRQDNVFKRLWMSVELMVGKTSLLVAERRAVVN